MHQAAGRSLRKDIVVQMKKHIKELENVELDDLLEKVEMESVSIENRFLKMLAEGAENGVEVDENGVEKKQNSMVIPVFDFEIN